MASATMRYNGKTACFAEPVYAYCKGRGKADAEWGVGLMLGKTEAQDAWIIGDGVDVILSRSIRRGINHGLGFWPTMLVCKPTALSIRPTFIAELSPPRGISPHNVKMASCYQR